LRYARGKTLILTFEEVLYGIVLRFDLHSSNTYVGIIDEDGGRLWKKKLRNDPSLISETLRPFKKDLPLIVPQKSR